MAAKFPYLIVVSGPTGVGKTEIAIKLAKYLDTEIISADSRQIFKELNIGTAKPDEKQLAEVKHHLINYISVSREFSAGDFERVALELLDDLFKRKRSVILCGGSGLYIKALLEGFDDLPEVPEEIKIALNKEYKRNGLAQLLDELETKDPQYFRLVDKKNPQRILRALAVIRTSGGPFSGFRSGARKKRKFKTIKIGLNIPKAELDAILEKRLDEMVRAGLIDEAAHLQQFRNKNSLKTVGYQEAFDYLDGKLTLEECVDQMKKNSRQYAKRQLTWFRKDSEISWFKPNEFELILKHINKNLK